MSDLTRVYIEGGTDSETKPPVEINPKYVYIFIPAEYACIYQKLLILLAEYGEEALKDCKSDCNNKNKTIIKTFNMFNAAVAAYKLDNMKLADTIIKYVNAQINQLIKENTITNDLYYVDSNGEIEALLTCGDTPKFEINPDDFSLWESITDEDKKGVYIINDGTLIKE